MYLSLKLLICYIFFNFKQALASCCCFYPSLQSVIEANDLVAMGEVEDLPLTVALAALLRGKIFAL